MEVVVTTGLLELWVVQSPSQTITTNKPTSSFFYRLDAFPVTQPTVSKHWRENITFQWLAYPKLTWGSSSFVSWALIAPGYLGGDLPCLSSALWCQYPKMIWTLYQNNLKIVIFIFKHSLSRVNVEIACWLTGNRCTWPARQCGTDCTLICPCWQAMVQCRLTSSLISLHQFSSHMTHSVWTRYGHCCDTNITKIIKSVKSTTRIVRPKDDREEKQTDDGRLFHMFNKEITTKTISATWFKQLVWMSRSLCGISKRKIFKS